MNIEPTQVEPLMGLHFKGKLLTLLENIRLELKWLAVTNATTYNTGVGFKTLHFLRSLQIGPIS